MVTQWKIVKFKLIKALQKFIEGKKNTKNINVTKRVLKSKQIQRPYFIRYMIL